MAGFPCSVLITKVSLLISMIKATGRPLPEGQPHSHPNSWTSLKILWFEFERYGSLRVQMYGLLGLCPQVAESDDFNFRRQILIWEHLRSPGETQFLCNSNLMYHPQPEACMLVAVAEVSFYVPWVWFFILGAVHGVSRSLTSP